MSERILCVDDDRRILDGFQRQLDDDYDLYTSTCPEEGLEIVRSDGPFAVVVSDMRMPTMTGVELLARVRECSPDTVRIILTGYADLNSTIAAVNEGHIFRFLSKPCSTETLARSLDDGLRQYRLVTAERELVEGTLMGCVKVLGEVLGLVQPEAFGRAARIKRIVSSVADTMNIDNRWELEIAAMLHPLGYVSVPVEILRKELDGQPLSSEERATLNRHPQAAGDLLRNIPRLDGVAEIVACQSLESANENHKGGRPPIAARVLQAALAFDELETKLGDPNSALKLLAKDSAGYDASVIDALQTLTELRASAGTCRLPVAALKTGMILANDVRDSGGRLMVAKGHCLTPAILSCLSNLSGSQRIADEVEVESGEHSEMESVEPAMA